MLLEIKTQEFNFLVSNQRRQERGWFLTLLAILECDERRALFSLLRASI